MQLLLAGNVLGEFDSTKLTPNLATLNPAVAQQVVTTPTGVLLQFVAPSTNNQFQPTVATSNWADTANWSTGVIPTSRDIIVVENASAQAQRLDVEELAILPNSKNAFAHELTLLGTTNTMAVTVQEGSSLSATVGVNVGNHGLVELAGGTIVTSSVKILPGGRVMGEGSVIGDMRVGTPAGAGEAVLQPGVTVGRLNIDGGYQQETNGVLLMGGTGTNQFDAVNITGAATLGGTLRIDAFNFTTFTPNTTFEIMNAGSLAGSFEKLEWIGDDETSFYYYPVYDYENGIVSLSSVRDLDMNGDQDPDPADVTDVRLFVVALMNEDVQKFWDKCGTQCDGTIWPQHHGDLNGNGRVDFDDLDILEGIEMPPGELAKAFDWYFNQVPEPSSAVLFACGGLLLSAARGYRPRRL
jgi:hypothetical protein